MVHGQELRQVSQLKLLGKIVSKKANYSNFPVSITTITLEAEVLKK